MKRIMVSVLFIVLCLFCGANAQPLSTKIVRIEIDGQEVRRSYKVFFLSNGKWIESVKTATGFVLPSELRTDEYLTVLITFGKHKLKFSKIHISNFNADWIVGVDKKPFSEEFVKPEEAKITKRVYYIQFEGGDPSRLLVITEKRTE